MPEGAGLQAGPEEFITVRVQRAVENWPGARQLLPFQMIKLGVQRLQGGTAEALRHQDPMNACSGPSFTLMSLLQAPGDTAP